MRGADEARHRAVPLNGWKAIADYLGRNQSTVKRWAAEGGLPVHRPQGAAGRKGVPVYAFSHELDAWLKGRQFELESDELYLPGSDAGRREKSLPHVDAGKSEPEHRIPTYRKEFNRRGLIFGGLAACAAVVLGLGAFWQRSNHGAIEASDLSPEVRQLYLDAHYLWQRRTPDSLREAEELLLRVRQLAPRFSRAQADLATVYNLMVEYGVLPPQEGYDRSKAAAGLAIALDPDLSQPYSVLGDITVFWDRNFDIGLSYFEKAVSLGSADAQARHWYAAALMGVGRFKEAADQIVLAREIEPLSRSIGVSSAMIQLGLGQHDNARAALLQIIDNEPGYRSPYRFLSFAELARGDYQAYLDALEMRFTLTADEAGLVVARAGRAALESGGSAEMARVMLATGRSLPATGLTLEPYWMAHFLALAGNWAEAAQTLSHTQTRHAFYYGIDPAFAQARENGQFLQVIHDAGLPVIRLSEL